MTQSGISLRSFCDMRMSPASAKFGARYKLLDETARYLTKISLHGNMEHLTKNESLSLDRRFWIVCFFSPPVTRSCLSCLAAILTE
jgi:hypothetical protein